MSATDAYDQIPYPNFAFPQTHPDRLATLATRFGMTPAPVEKCRVLELGCGNGGNLIPMAFGLPGSQFVGIDRAEQAIGKGNATTAALGLENIKLLNFDINDLSDQLGRFDYVIAHGLYSWVPAEIRDRILKISRSTLAPQGVLYISYNTYPGCHLRNIARELMLFHTRDVMETHERIVQGRALINWLADSRPVTNAYQALLNDLRQHLNEKNEAAIYHDDLAALNTPVYFHEFVDHAARHGLQFLSEAEYFDVQYSQLPAEISEQMNALAEKDILSKEQYMDFLEGRSFRQSLLCHHEVKLDRNIAPARINHFYLKGEVQAQSADPDLAPGAVEEFRGQKESSLATDLSLGKAALLQLGKIYPGAMRFDELVDEGRRALVSKGHEAVAFAEGSEQALATLLLKAYGAGVVEMHLFSPRFASTPGHRPLASPLARLQALEGPIITTLLHNNIKLEDDLGRQLLLLLDGKRNRTDLLHEMQLIMRAAHADTTGAEIRSEKEKFLDSLPRDLEEKLCLLAKLGLLLE
ncbi:MAG TPA: class I SAM-dependent methyltransferase [Pyrinomonadaceae bacterium]|nr:class I SAM-dependent methyltransferase [Pyrinomonadaceae bacterium]